MQLEKKSIRAKLLNLRANLSASTQDAAAQKILPALEQHTFFNQAQHIAVYHAINSELDLSVVIKQIWQQNKQCYLPYIDGKDIAMQFAHYDKSTPLAKSKCNTIQPRNPSCINLEKLDLILVPGVGFTHYGVRLGMGGGCYDKALAHCMDKDVNLRPYLCGIAYSVQMQGRLPSDIHDVAMDKVIYI